MLSGKSPTGAVHSTSPEARFAAAALSLVDVMMTAIVPSGISALLTLACTLINLRRLVQKEF